MEAGGLGIDEELMDRDGVDHVVARVFFSGRGLVGAQRICRLRESVSDERDSLTYGRVPAGQFDRAHVAHGGLQVDEGEVHARIEVGCRGVRRMGKDRGDAR